MDDGPLATQAPSAPPTESGASYRSGITNDTTGCATRKTHSADDMYNAHESDPYRAANDTPPLHSTSDMQLDDTYYDEPPNLNVNLASMTLPVEGTTEVPGCRPDTTALRMSSVRANANSPPQTTSTPDTGTFSNTINEKNHSPRYIFAPR